MGEEERLLIADLEAVKKVWPILDTLNTLDLPQLIDKAIMPFLKNEGHAKWQRDVVTDMAIKKGDTTKGTSWKHKDKDDEIK